MSWQLIVLPALVLAGVAGTFGVWMLAEDLILDRIPLPCTWHFEEDEAR
jgi:hypothetical protein